MVRSVSVIIPTYNRKHVITRALTSVLKQSVSAAEIIVVDDGSTDETEEFIRERFPSVRVIQQEHSGVSAARNRGIAAASGEWIALLDSDDEWLPDKLASQLAALDQNPELRVCHTDEIWIRNGVRVNAGQKHAKHEGRIYLRCLPLCAMSPSSILIHRDVFTQVGTFDESLPACEDYDLWLRICARFPVLFVEQKLLRKFGGHDDQLSRQHWGMDRFRVQALENALSHLPLNATERWATLATLVEKLQILVDGAVKRDQSEHVASFREKLAGYRHMEELHRPVHIVVAFLREAMPIIEQLGLEKSSQSGTNGTLYRRGRISLVISGPGNAKARAAVQQLASSCDHAGDPLWINVGICGHRDLPLGSLLAANEVHDAESGNRWALPVDDHIEAQRTTVISVCHPETNYPQCAAYDMEAAGFVDEVFTRNSAASARCFKIVSDNAVHSLAQVTPQLGEQLVRKHVNVLTEMCLSGT